MSLFDDFKAFSLKLHLKSPFVFLKLLLFGDQRVSEHIHLTMELRYLLVVNLFQFGHGLLNGHDLLVFFLNYFEELSLLGLEKLSALLLLFGLS